MKKYKRIYHLSHTDLDGYGSQFMIKLLKHENVYYSNAKYEDVAANISKIFSEIYQTHNKEKILFLITDLALKEKDAKKINNFLRGNNHIDLTIQVLDHHKSSADIAAQNDWYLFDNTKCGAMLTAEFVAPHLNKERQEKAIFTGTFIQAHDLWQEDSPYFSSANLLADTIFDFYFPDFLEEEKREFLLDYIDTFIEEYKLPNSKILTTYEMEEIKPFMITHTIAKKNTFSNLFSKNVQSYEKLCKYQAIKYLQKDFELLEYKDYKFRLLFDTDRTFFQYFSHNILRMDKDTDFILNIRPKGSISLRSEGNIDVAKIAWELGEGGGHKNSAAGKINVGKEKLHSYEEAASFVKKII